MSYPEYWKKSQRGYFSSILDIPDSYKNFEKIVSYNESERSTKIMECYKCISMKKAGRRSSMKSHFHGLRGLGGRTSGGRLFCTDRSGTETFPNKLKRHLYVQMHCLPISDIYVARVESYARIGHKRR